MRYWVQCNTFDMGDLKGKALKPLEEASEAREAVQRWSELRGGDGEVVARNKAMYECCDTLQATLNLLAALGASQLELDDTMEEVRRHNEKRGRYE